MCNARNQRSRTLYQFVALLLFIGLSASTMLAGERPVMSIVAPTDATAFTTPSPSLTIGGSCSPAVTTHSISYQLSGATTGSGTATPSGLASDGTYRWHFPVTLSPGQTQVNITVTDSKGYTDTSSLSLTYGTSSRKLVLWNGNDLRYSQTAGITKANILLKLDNAVVWSQNEVTIAHSAFRDEATGIDLPLGVTFDAVRVEITESPVCGGLSEIQVIENDVVVTSGVTAIASSFLDSSGQFVASHLIDGITHSWEVAGIYGYWLLNNTTTGWAEVQFATPFAGIDTVAPTLAVLSPTADTTFTTPSPSFTLCGKAGDNIGITEVTYALSGATTATGNATTGISSDGILRWNAPLTLNDGTTTATITAHDAAGNTTSKTLTLNYSLAAGRQLVVWNGNNRAHGDDRGVTMGNLTLRLNGKDVWISNNITIDRVAGRDAGTAIALPNDIAFDEVNFDITASFGPGGGLSEMQIVENGTVYTGNVTVTASNYFNSNDRFITSHICDSITHSLEVAGIYGYWLLPNMTTGWVNLDFPTAFDASAPPVIDVSTPANAIVGVAFNYQLITTGDPTEYTADGLPVGLSFNTGTGVISGTPSEAGSYSVTVSATNIFGTGTEILTLVVDPDPDAMDPTAPTLTLVAPVNASTFTSPSPKLTLCGSVSDNVGITEMTYTLSGDTTGSGTPTRGVSGDGIQRWSVPLTLNIGTTTATVKAKDAAGNVTQKAITITYAGYDEPALVLWNGNNMMHGNDRGTTVGNVVLLLDGNEVWRQDNVTVNRQPGYDASTVVSLPAVHSFNGVRFEITSVFGVSAGISEIQVIANNQIVSEGSTATASDFLNSGDRFISAHISDGITHSLEIAGTYGYWLPATNGTGWVQLALQNTVSVSSTPGDDGSVLNATTLVDQDTIAQVQVTAPAVSAADIYLVLLRAGGQYFSTCNEAGDFQENTIVPVKRNWTGSETAETIFSGAAPIVAPGQYQWVVVFVNANQIPLDTSQWQKVLTQDVIIQTTAALYMNQTTYSRGDTIELRVTLPPLETADVYLGLTLPGESAPLYYVALQSFQGNSQPLVENFTSDALRYIPVFVLPLWMDIPSGEYRWDLVITPTGGDPASPTYSASATFTY